MLRSTAGSIGSEPPMLRPPGADEVHIWRVALEDPALPWDRFATTLAPDEQTRAARFHFERDRQRFVTARGILRALLAAYLGRPPAALSFVYGPRGKPALADAGADTLRFNLAHSADVALYALARGRDVGVDLEQVRPLADAEAIAARFFSAGERSMLENLPPPDRLVAFFQLWTRKEAYLKARGAGLAGPLEALEVLPPPGATAPQLRIAGNPQATIGWALQDLPLGPEYAAALVVQRPGPQIAYRQWRAEHWNTAILRRPSDVD